MKAHRNGLQDAERKSIHKNNMHIEHNDKTHAL